jgi:hypothetical protein
MGSPLAIVLAEPGANPERLEELTIQLREELLGLDVEDVQQVMSDDTPAGSRSVELAVIGALLVTLKDSTELVTKVVSTVREWLHRNPEAPRTVRVTLGDRTIELTAASSEQQEQLVAEFVRAGAGDKDGG